MKKIVNGALVSMMLAGAPLAAQAEKLAVVDMGTVFQQIPQREQMTNALKAEFGDRMAEVQKMQDDLKGMMEKQQRDAALMTEAQKTELGRKMEQTKADLQLKGKALDEDLRRRQGEEQNKLLVKVQKAINDIAKQDQYDMVLQRGAVIYVKPEADISNKVVEALSKGQ
ncbi:OmpH family outer membrane protein [Shewanella mangrovi]|uniref:OmpH family outer membrane protein n=1 Tax=Shewanella mangrovi TaxID=1515746 RepID=UPI000A960016|nr:OmpH family outer membrane protein [Shewanella mangrovi]